MSGFPTGERRDRPKDAPELESLEAFLDWQRATVPMKLAGVGDDEARRPGVPSGTSLLGVVRHLGYVERHWYRMTFAGQDDLDPGYTDDDPDADWRVGPDETVASVLDFYEGEVVAARAVVAGASPDDPSRGSRRARDGKPFSLRWIHLHMIEETARHLGHLDILREQADGTTGY